MMNLTQTLMIAAVAVALIAVLQIAASAQPITPRTLSFTGDQANFVMTHDRGYYGGDAWRDDRWRYDRGDRWRYDRDDRWRYRDDPWRYDRDWRRHRHHDNDDALLIGGALLGLYLLTR